MEHCTQASLHFQNHLLSCSISPDLISRSMPWFWNFNSKVIFFLCCYIYIYCLLTTFGSYFVFRSLTLTLQGNNPHKGLTLWRRHNLHLNWKGNTNCFVCSNWSCLSVICARCDFEPSVCLVSLFWKSISFREKILRTSHTQNKYNKYNIYSA